MKLRTVVVGVDFSAASLSAAQWVGTHLAPDAEIVLVHVLPEPEAPPSSRCSPRRRERLTWAMSGWPSGRWRSTLRTTRSSPGAASKITSGATRESTQPTIMISGRCPASASSS